MVDINNLVTTRELCSLFSKTPMTIYLWRKAKGLPFIQIKGVKKHAIRFDIEAVKEWAEEHGKAMLGVPTIRRLVQRRQFIPERISA